LRDQPEKKEKTAHPTTINANVTDVEEEAANFPARTQPLESARVSHVGDRVMADRELLRVGQQGPGVSDPKKIVLARRHCNGCHAMAVKVSNGQAFPTNTRDSCALRILSTRAVFTRQA